MILFIDVDGTLVDYENNLPDSAVEAIRRARKNGHLVYISTGRSRAEVYEPIWDIGIDGMIGGNGSYVEGHEKVLMHQKLTLEDTGKILDWLNERKLEYYLESNSGLYASENFETRGQSTICEYAQKKGDSKIKSVRDAFPDMIFEAFLLGDDVNKISYVLDSYEDYLAAKDRFPEYQHGTWGGAGETALFGDVGVKDITKAHAIDVHHKLPLMRDIMNLRGQI